MRRTTALLVLVAALLAGCASADRVTTADGSASDQGDGPPAGEPGGRDDGLFVSVDVGGGFVPVGHDFRSVPTAVVDDDGRTITPGPVIEVFPGPAVTPLREGQLDDAELDDLLAAARDAGVLEAGGMDLGEPPIADAATTTVTVVVDGETSVVEAYALGASAGDVPGVSAEQQAARTALEDFVRQVSDAVTEAEEGTFVPDRYRVLPLPPGAMGGDEVEPHERDWPFPDLELEEGRCTAVTGERADAFRPVLEDADEITIWRTPDGGRWTLAVRPVLPHEPDCPS